MTTPRAPLEPELPPEFRPVGPPVRRLRRDRHLTQHIPIRFDAAVIERVKEIAYDDGLTVSSWIRLIVERELNRRD